MIISYLIEVRAVFIREKTVTLGDKLNSRIAYSSKFIRLFSNENLIREFYRCQPTFFSLLLLLNYDVVYSWILFDFIREPPRQADRINKQFQSEH